MGSPVSVTVANLAMEGVERRAQATFPNPPKFWKLYIDHNYCAIATSNIDRFHQHIKSIEPHIHCRDRDRRTAPFLALLLRCEEDSSTSTSVYRKSTHTDRYLDFSSHHPKRCSCLYSHVQSSVIALLQLAHTNDEVRVTTALQSNGYPLDFTRTSSTPTGAVPDDGLTQTSSSILYSLHQRCI